MRIRINKTKKELSTLQSQLKGKKLAHFLHAEIIKKFGNNNESQQPCNSIYEKGDGKIIKKQTSVDLPLEIENRIKCNAASLGINPSAYISRTIIDPLLYH